MSRRNFLKLCLIICLVLPITSANPAAQTDEALFPVKLTLKNQLDVERLQEPVTSGIPLPQGQIKIAENGQPYLKLTDTKENPIPAQFRVLSKWPDGSARWVLLDFPASLKSEKTDTLLLDKSPTPNNIAASPLKLTQTENSIEINTGKVTFSLNTRRFNLFEKVILAGKSANLIAAPSQPAIFFTGKDGKTYASIYAPPPKITIEEQGPQRICLKIHGDFADNANKIFMPDVAQYTVRIHAYANQDFVRMFFTLENNGRYGFEHDDAPPEYIDFKEMALRLNLKPAARVATQDYHDDFEPQERFFLYQRHNIVNPNDESKNFNYSIKKHDKTVKGGNRFAGWVEVAGKDYAADIGLRYFWQNYPKSVTYYQNSLTLGLWPWGDRWPPPPTVKAGNTIQVKAQEQTGTGDFYHFRPGTHKMYELLVRFHGGDGFPIQKLAEGFNHPLMLTPPPQWYARTGVLGMLAARYTEPVTARGMIPFKGLEEKDADLKEALLRYERLQDCKAHVEASEIQHDEIPPSTIYTEREGRGENINWYGWMDFGDIPWGGENGEGAYCSLHYDWTYGMLLQFVRSGDYSFFELGNEMAHHRLAVDQYHTDRGSPWYNNFQWNEFGNHDRSREPWEPNPSHTWVQGLVLYYLLTGNEAAMDAARDVGRATIYYWTHDWGDDGRPGSSEIRIQGWSIENMLTLYQLTCNAKYLTMAKKIFHERTVPFIKPEGYTGDPADINMYQLVLAIEPMIKLNQIAPDENLRDTILRVLDFFINKAYHGGKLDESGKYTQLYLPYMFNAKINFVNGTAPGYNFMAANAFAYAYLITGDPMYRDWARRAFRDATFYWQEETAAMDSATRSAIAYAAMEFPGSRSKVHGWINRYPMIYLYMEDNPKTDVVPPAKIADLEVRQTGPDKVALDWSAPGDDGMIGKAAEYQIKYSTYPMNSNLEWLQASNVSGEPTPEAPYAPQTFAISGLKPGQIYYFAIRAWDKAGNQSPLSNIATITINK